MGRIGGAGDANGRLQRARSPWYKSGMGHWHLCPSPPAYEADGYRFEFSRWTGPVLVGKRGEPLSRQPGSRSPFWASFQRWLEQQP